MLPSGGVRRGIGGSPTGGIAMGCSALRLRCWITEAAGRVIKSLPQCAAQRLVGEVASRQGGPGRRRKRSAPQRASASGEAGSPSGRIVLPGRRRFAGEIREYLGTNWARNRCDQLQGAPISGTKATPDKAETSEFRAASFLV